MKFSGIVKICLSLCFLMTITACGRISQTQDDGSASQKSESSQTFKSLNESFASIHDSSTASQAIDDLQDYANKRTLKGIQVASFSTKSLRTFSISEGMKQKLIQIELAMRTKAPSDSTIKIASVENTSEDLSVEEYMKLKETEAQSGLSSQAIADALNQTVSDQKLTVSTVAMKTANTIHPFTKEDIEHIREKTLELLPNSGNRGSDRITPIEALMIGYAAVSHDDGTQKDGEVDFPASQDQVSQFVSKITNIAQ